MTATLPPTTAFRDLNYKIFFALTDRETQCDQMAFIVFIICPFTAVKNCLIVYKI